MTTRCEDCRFRTMNFRPPKKCPNPRYFMTCFLRRQTGEDLPEDDCERFEWR